MTGKLLGVTEVVNQNYTVIDQYEIKELPRTYLIFYFGYAFFVCLKTSFTCLSYKKSFLHVNIIYSFTSLIILYACYFCYLLSGMHGSCEPVRQSLQAIMRDPRSKEKQWAMMRGDKKREEGFRTARFCPIPVGDSPSSKRMYDVMNVSTLE